MAHPGWVSRLGSILEGRVSRDVQIEVDGRRPALAVRLRTAEEVSRVLGIATEEGLGVIPLGGGTLLHLGNPPSRADFFLQINGSEAAFQHSPEDLVATLPAGMTVARANKLLAAKGQVLPVDPPYPEKATIGGSISSGCFGPRRQRFGRLRDSILGLRVVLPNGDITRVGGRVVKNVTGYDMAKLYTGSFGTLGIVVEATLKLHPLPEEVRSQAFGFPTLDGALRTADDVLEGGLEPAAMALLNPRVSTQAGLPGAYHLLVEFADIWEVVRRQVRESEVMARSRGGEVLALKQEAAKEAWTAASCLSKEWEVTLRCSVPRAYLDPFLSGALEIMEAPEVEKGVLAYPGFGASFLGMGGLDAEASRRAFEEIAGLAASLEGHAILERATLDVKSSVDVWGPSPSGMHLMSRLKREFDPQGILNPGRFVGGL